MARTGFGDLSGIDIKQLPTGNDGTLDAVAIPRVHDQVKAVRLCVPSDSGIGVLSSLRTGRMYPPI